MKLLGRRLGSTFLLLLFTLLPAAASPQAVDNLDPALKAKVDRIAAQVLEETGVPSASLALVQHGKLVYTHAYGNARLATDSSPAVPATPAMRYSIGSISKQFTAAAILLLQEQGKLSLDDPVGKYIPGLTRGNEVTIRQILSHTSGYQDYWPEDYVMTPMLAAHHRSADPRHLGQKAARLRSRRRVAVLQHQLRHRRPHRRDRLRPAALRLPHPAHLPPPRHDLRLELRRGRAHAGRRHGILSPRAGPAAPRAKRRPRLDVRRRRAGHDRARPRPLG